MKDQEITHSRGAPNHPQAKDEIERYHLSKKNCGEAEKLNYPWNL